jgi:hypothetical protein
MNTKIYTANIKNSKRSDIKVSQYEPHQVAGKFTCKQGKKSRKTTKLLKHPVCNDITKSFAFIIFIISKGKH